MSMNYKKEIALKNLEGRLLGQKLSLANCEAEILKYRERIETYETTMASLNKEIKITEKMIADVEGGEK